MSIFKKKKSYEIVNDEVVEKGYTQGVPSNKFICEKIDHVPVRKINLPDRTTKIYIVNE